MRNYPRENGSLDFGDAIRLLKAGKQVSRAGWNGKGMWLVLQKGSRTAIDLPVGSAYHKAGLTTVAIDSHIDMYTAGGTMQPGWLASQADMLAEDWCIA